MKAVGITFIKHHPAEKLTAEGADLIVGCLREVNAETVTRLLGRVDKTWAGLSGLVRSAAP